MSDILALNSDSLSSPSIKIKTSLESGTIDSIGWGLGWYPNDDNSAVIIKDAVSRDTQDMVQALTDWASFRFTVLMCNSIGAAKRPTQHDTQPFRRSFSGTDWLFIHDGEFSRDDLEDIHDQATGFLEPLGKTDSELAFCLLLGRIHASGSKSLKEAKGRNILDWFGELDFHGSADIILSDGKTMVFYHGKNSTKPMFYKRFCPPNLNIALESNSLSLNLNDPRDVYRTFMMVSTGPFQGEDWEEMELGQLIMARRGAIVWNSQRTRPIPYPLSSFQSQIQSVSASTESHLEEKGSFSSLQTEQALTSAVTPSPEEVLHGSPDPSPDYRLYDVTHLTEYKYSEPVEHSEHAFRLSPMVDHDQIIMQGGVEISVPGEKLHFEDVFGNESIHYSISKPYTELRIESRHQVKIYASTPDDYTSSMRRTSIPLIWMPWQRQMMQSYLLPPELPETQLRELNEYAMSFVERNDYHLLQTIMDMNTRIYEDFTYKQGSTNLETTPFDIFTSRTGVCQDFANLLICLCRLLNIPARYRVGYIYTNANYENKIQSEASHAWTEVYLPFVGWRGFDPTNGCLVNQDHMRVACGRNYRDATPTAGTILKGGGLESLLVDVKMREV